MTRFRNAGLCLTAAMTLGPASVAQQNTPDLLDRAQDAVVAYIQNLANVHCTEDVEQITVRPNGKPDTKVASQFDYFVLLQGNSIDFQIAESRLAIGNEPQRQHPLLLSNGFSMMLLIFHPYYRDGFTFTPEGEDEIEGRRTVRYHFAHISGTRTPAALALRERQYPLDLQGSAWVDAESGQPLQMDAELLHPMTDIGLRALAIHVEYQPNAAIPGHPVLASVADVDLETPRQHWRNSHQFRNYRLFSTDATQDPNVKVHASAAATQDDSAQQSKEKP